MWGEIAALLAPTNSGEGAMVMARKGANHSILAPVKVIRGLRC
jgi:hypothetical protein